MINEPTAAALSIACHRPDLTPYLSRTLVFDFGGGTLDVSLVDASKNPITVLGTSGDTQLGGRNFDQRLFKYLLNEYEQQNKTSLREDRELLEELRQKCEEAKIDLGQNNETTLKVGETFRLVISKSKFEELCADLFERIMVPIDNVLSAAHLTTDNITRVVLVGGSSAFPQVRDRLEQRFPGKVLFEEPRLVVAKGAALLAYRIKRNVAHPALDVRSLGIVDICPRSIGIQTRKDRMEWLIMKSSQLPCRNKMLLMTMEFDQTEIPLTVFEGDNIRASQNQQIGPPMRVTGIPRDVPRAQMIIVRAKLDRNCILHLKAITANGRQRCEMRPFLNDAPIRDMEYLAVARAQEDQTNFSQIETQAEMKLLCKNMRIEIQRKSENPLLKRKIWNPKRPKFEDMIGRWENDAGGVPTIEDMKRLQKAFRRCFGGWYRDCNPPNYLNWLLPLSN
jgi:molecular chaperone DnaK (HSP70)